MPIAEQKKRLRAQMRETRRALSDSDQLIQANNLLDVFKRYVTPSDFPLALYLSFDGELATDALVEHCWSLGEDVYLPIIKVSGEPLHFSRYRRQTQLAANRFGIPEPVDEPLLPASELKLMCIPLTAFDSRGYRLGMGGGFYDRTLDGLAPKPRLVGLAYSFQQVDACPVDDFDQKLDCILTPDGVIEA